MKTLQAPKLIEKSRKLGAKDKKKRKHKITSYGEVWDDISVGDEVRVSKDGTPYNQGVIENIMDKKGSKPGYHYRVATVSGNAYTSDEHDLEKI